VATTESLDLIAANWALVASAVALLVGAFVAWRAIMSSRGVARQEAVFRYMERWQSPPLTRVFGWVREFWSLRDDRDARKGSESYDTLSLWRQEYVWVAFNFYEEVASAHARGLFDEQLFEENMAPILMQDWCEAHWLVNHLRKGDGDILDGSLWRYWQTVYLRGLAKGLEWTRTQDSDESGVDFMGPCWAPATKNEAKMLAERAAKWAGVPWSEPVVARGWPRHYLVRAANSWQGRQVGMKVSRRSGRSSLI
jgi:hypothetical protein